MASYRFQNAPNSPRWRVRGPKTLLTRQDGELEVGSLYHCLITLGCWVQHCLASVSALAHPVEPDLMLLILGEFLNPKYLLGDEACLLLEYWSSYPFYPSHI
ncbi:hypothetical protein Bca4012_018510 [Brassica carinata]